MNLNGESISKIIMNSIHDLVVVIDENRLIKYHNQSFENFLMLNNISFTDLRNKDIKEILPPPSLTDIGFRPCLFRQEKSHSKDPGSHQRNPPAFL